MTRVYDTATDIITFARLQSQNTTSGSSYLGSDGLLKFAAEDEPRIEYGSDGSLKGLLIEELRANLITYSEDFTATEWIASNTAPLATNSIGPDGKTSAVTLSDSGAGGTGQVEVRDASVPVVELTTYTASFFAKADQLSVATIRLAGGFNLTIVSFDLSSGEVLSGSGSIEDFGNGWYRCSVTATTKAGATSIDFRIVLSETAGNLIVNLDGTSSILIYGAQLEAGSFPTSYIPTSGSQSTRSADVASIPVTAFGYNQDAGSLLVEFSKMYDGSGGFHAGFGANNTNYVGIGYGSTQAAFVQPLTGAINVSGASAPSPGEFATVAAGFDASGATSAVDGQSRNQTATGSAPALSQSDTLYLGTSPFSPVAIASGHIKSLKYYPRRLTDAQLQELTA